MGINIGGATIAKNASNSGITLNNSLVFNPAGQGTVNNVVGYNAWKVGPNHYAGLTGWETNTIRWQAYLNTTNGVFNCPTVGIYALGYNGIHRGGSNVPAGFNCYGFSGFAKNGVLAYFVHWNMSASHMYNTGGTSALFQCAAGDTLALFINRSPPTPAVANDIYTQNYGMHPDAHHCVWCKLVG